MGPMVPLRVVEVLLDSMAQASQWGDLLLPFTAGTFLYVGTVAVIPELLETGKDKMKELRQTLIQFSAMALGAGIML